MEQKYFPYNNQYFKPQKDQHRTPLPGTLAELYQQN